MFLYYLCRLNMQGKDKNLIIRSSVAEFLIFEQQKKDGKWNIF